MAKNCLIYEALNDVKDMQVVKKDDGLMTLSGVFGVCGVRNNNQRVYETSNYSKMVQEMQERIKADGGIPGELEHPQMMNITLENISHKITDINIDENGLVTGTITLLNTPKGKIAQAIVEGGIPLHISSRATGAVDSKTGNVTLERIATYDLVGTPGFSQARLNLNESQIDDLMNRISEDHSTVIDNTVYAQISESNVFYITEKENETNENNLVENDMEMKEILEKIEALESRINDLEAENESLRGEIEEAQAPQFDLEKLANGIQKWIVEEYSPMIQQWVMEEYSPVNNDEVVETATDNVKDYIAEEIAPQFQQWVVEHYSPEVEKWCINEFAQGIQNWILEQYAPEVENWMNESYSAKLTEKITEGLKDMVAETIKENKQSNISAIDETLKLLENLEVTKPTYSRKALITENADEPKFIQEMPAESRVKWDLASSEVKESIMRRAKLYNFTNEGAVEKFWESIDFNGIKPVANIYEGLEAIEDERERSIRMKLRSSRFRK